jgi:NTE family protein
MTIFDFCTPLFKGVLLVLLLFNPIGVWESTAQDKPKIGLVLSGGGAKGLAHIGILKSLEEAGITPDYITGTSMGSIMGGLYAIGYSADEIKQIALEADWDRLLSNKSDLNEVVFEEKDYYNRYITELNINGSKFELPKGLIEGQKLSNLLSNLTRPVHSQNDFSQLPIPFACLAADIETGLPVVLNSGSLARSMRASMAISSIFTPVEIDGQLLVDGGLVRNFPVEDNLEMGADYIIGVFVGNQLLSKDEMNSPLSVLAQSAFIHGSFDTEIQRKLVDIYIEPDMETYGAGSFTDAEAIIEIGEKYGQMYLEEFKNLKDSLEILGWINSPVNKPVARDSIYVAEIKVLNNQIVPETFILDRLGLQPDSWITIDQLETGIDNLYGTRYFTKILYEINDGENSIQLIIDVGEAPNGILKAALQYDMETEISLLVNLTYRNLLFNNSRIILEGEISNTPLLDINYLKYFGSGQRYSLITGYYYRNTGIPLIEEETTVALYETSQHRFFAGVQTSFRTNQIVQLLYEHERTSLRPEVFSNTNTTINKLNFKAHNILLKFEHNSLNNRYYPSHGSHHKASVKFRTSIHMDIVDEPSDTLDLPAGELNTSPSISPSVFDQWVIPLTDRMSLGLKTEFNFNIHLEESADTFALQTGILDMNYIGGYRKLIPNFHSFWGAELSQYNSEHLFSSELMLQYKIGRQIYLQVLGQFYHAYLPFGWIFPAMKESIYEMGGRNYLLGFGASAGYMSPLGPISVSVGKDIHSSNAQFFLNIGFYLDPD